VDGVVSSERREWCGGVVPQEEPHFLPPIHKFGHGDVEIRIDDMPRFDVDNPPPKSTTSVSEPCGRQTQKK
jgi:hypothetical protein